MVMKAQFLIIPVCLLHASFVVAQTISASRLVTAKPLFTDGTRITQTAPNDDTEIRARHAKLHPISGSYVQIDTANLS